MTSETGDALSGFAEPTRAWFTRTFDSPTEVQARGWPLIASGRNALLIAPTGSGKTLAAFLSCIDHLTREPEGEPGTRVLYVSPLKALVYDVERNLRSPLVGVERTAAQLGEPVRVPTVSVRTGDTTQRERRQQLKQPGDILVTTPESLYLLLGSAARETLRTVRTVIVDEVHALAPTKRGAHLALSLERLSELCRDDPQRVGLSATATPLDEVARFLGGDRDVAIVDASSAPELDVRIVVPVEDMSRPVVEVDDSANDDGESLMAPQRERSKGIWPAVYPQLLELIHAHRSTILFVNSRGLCERLTHALNDEAGEPLVRSHHGSLAREQRKEIEEALKAGEIRAIVATSSLELGIDMGAVDLVVLVESPGSVSRGLQRVGRAGHDVGATSVARIFPKHRGDLLECAVVSERMRRGQLEPLAVPENALDVLAQQLVAMCGERPRKLADVERLIRRARNYRDLPRDALTGVLDMLSGKYPSSAFADLKPRLNWDRDSDELSSRRGAKTIAAVNGGTIPDRGTYVVQLGDEGPRLGELDEEMVHETTAGQTFTLGTSTWRVEQITRDRVIVSPAPGEAGKLPFWHGDGPGRPMELGRALGELTRKIATKLDAGEAESWLADYGLDALAAKNLTAYVAEQRAHSGALPTDRSIVIERFRDELGDWRICILSPFGSRVHAPWALALGAALSGKAGFEVQTLWSDDGIVLRFVDLDELPEAGSLIPDSSEVEDRVVEQVASSALFASQFRENAGRALLLPKRRPGQRRPLWAQRLKAQELMGVAKDFPSFPIIMETYRSCLRDVFDLPALVELLGRIERREVRVHEVETAGPSPFARSLVFAYVAAYMYAGDAPVAERRAQALSLDRQLLAELLGSDQLRDVLDARAIDEAYSELQHTAEGRRARHADDLHDLLRKLGDLSDEEIRARSETAPTAWLDELIASRRALKLKVAGETRYIAVEDAATYRDGLGCQLPPGLPAAFLGPRERPVEELLARYARTNTPFTTAAARQRFALPREAVEAVLNRLERAGKLMRGHLCPGGSQPEWCDPDVLRRIKRKTLAALRGQVEPVDAGALARFLPQWHGIGDGECGLGRLEEVVIQLEGLPLSVSELEQRILPARVADFRPAQLDELGARGFLVWVGCGALGSSDGRVALYRRDRIAALYEPSRDADGLEPLHERLLAHLESRGASFFTELQLACRPAPQQEVLDALWDLVWRGLVTNDTFGPLRAITLGAARSQARTTRARGRQRGRQDPAAAGRWSLVVHLVAEAPEATERAHARAINLLERHGIVTREVSGLESLEGGFATMYRVLKAMEESGRVRRGYFVEGLGGAQFAYPGAVDRLRAARDHDGGSPLLLAATDPANPYGWLLPWPQREGEDAATPKRSAGATVVLVDGEPVIYLDKGQRSLITFPRAEDREELFRAVRALTPVARRGRSKLLRIERIDGEPARTSRHADTLRDADFVGDPRGLLLEK